MRCWIYWVLSLLFLPMDCWILICISTSFNCRLWAFNISLSCFFLLSFLWAVDSSAFLSFSSHGLVMWVLCFCFSHVGAYFLHIFLWGCYAIFVCFSFHGHFYLCSASVEVSAFSLGSNGLWMWVVLLSSFTSPSYLGHKQAKAICCFTHVGWFTYIPLFPLSTVADLSLFHLSSSSYREIFDSESVCF